MTINVSIPREFENNFTEFYPRINIVVPDRRFNERAVVKELENIVEKMLTVDPYRTTGRGVIKVDEAASWATESFEFTVNFIELTGEIKFKRSNRGQSRMI